MGGLVGALSISPSAAGGTLPVSYAAMPPHTVVLTHMSLCSCNPTTDPFRIISYQSLRAGNWDTSLMSATLGPEQVTDVLLVNGLWQPRMAMAPGSWHRFDIVNAVGDLYIELEVRTAVSLCTTSSNCPAGNTAACSIKLLALDGIFLFDGVRDVSYVAFAPASRASIAVMCPTAGTYYLQSNPANRASAYEGQLLQNLITLEVAGTAVTQAAPTAKEMLDAIVRPVHLQDLRSANATNAWQIGVEQTGQGAQAAGAWLGVGKNCALESGGRAGGTPSDPNTYGECPYWAFGCESAAPGCRPCCWCALDGRGHRGGSAARVRQREPGLAGVPPLGPSLSATI